MIAMTRTACVGEAAVMERATKHVGRAWRSARLSDPR